MGRVNSGTIIQKTWRGYKPQIDLLFALGNIIISQSVVRRHFAIKACRPLICVRRIQSLWRGYDCRNFYLKKRLARHQAVVLIQKIVRGFLQYSRFVIIHFEYQTLREKKAALKLEKFFIWVRKEVERNFNRREKIKLVRREKLQKKKAMTDEALLESIWLKTVDNKYYESGVQIFNMVACSKSRRKICGIKEQKGNKGNRCNSTRINRIYNDSSEIPRKNHPLKNNGSICSNVIDNKCIHRCGFGKNRQNFDFYLSKESRQSEYRQYGNDQMKLSHSNPSRFNFYNPNGINMLQYPDRQC